MSLTRLLLTRVKRTDGLMPMKTTSLAEVIVQIVGPTNDILVHFRLLGF